MRIVKRIAIFCLAAFALWVPLSYLLINFLIVSRRLDTADAIVVLSGSADHRHRTRAAAKLWKENVAERIILTNDGERAGWDSEQQRNPFFWELAKRGLIEEGVNAASIEVLPGLVSGTQDESELVVATAADRNYRSLFLVTSGYHTRRTLWTFERSAARRDLALELGIDSPAEDNEVATKLSWWLHRGRWGVVTSEITKLLYYRQVYN